ncbi:MAG: hypothetical protein ISR51_08185 [Rhodospirillales bacterium]|nr:hypothetical protein [Alphaproteobacteria bacterium]MBL6948641.1 hypothetical protein [Rhodospirillales bacterium]
MSKGTVKHEVKLETSVKVILAALAFGVLAHAFVPAFGVDSAFAAASKKIGTTSGLGTITVRFASPVQLGGNLNLGGKLGLGGAVQCVGCAPQ